METMEKANRLKLYRISADGGNTWSEQWLTKAEAQNERDEHGHIVETKD